MAVAEAVACGVPVVAFAAGEIASTMGDGTGPVALAAGDAVFVQRVHEAVAVLPPRLPPPRPQRSWDVAAQEFVTACRAIAASAVQKRKPT
jgi:glycosyltransferase involved in cell wall biosynthesis